VTEPNGKRAKLLGTIGVAAAAIAVLMVAGFAGAFGTANFEPAAPASPASPAGPGVGAGAGAGTDPNLPTPIKHVFLILMENEETGVIYGQVPYETQLANEYAWGGNANNPDAVGYYGVCHPSAPNYLALTSGQPLQCGSDAYSTYAVNNLGNLLDTAHESWTAWEESATVPCQTTTVGDYAVRHNPFPYYTDLQPGVPGGACETHDLPIANLTDDFPYSATPPAFTYIAPNVLNDAHNTNATYGDDWLTTFIPKLIAQPWFSSSVIFITYDEAYDAQGNENFSGYDGLVGGPVYTVAVSPYTLGVGALTYNTSHYNLLTTIEWLLGLPGTGTGNDSTSQFPVMAQLFQPSLFGPGVDLQYTDLKGVNLAGYDLRGDNLQYADFAGADLDGADLRGANLQYANFVGADLAGADFRGANLQYADLAGADLQGADFRGADLQFGDLTNAVLTGLGPAQPTDFDGASLLQAVLTGAVCGTPNYITAAGANVNAVGVPAACVPPL
jgi:phosphatidylinositol-3-phosphatase